MPGLSRHRLRGRRAQFPVHRQVPRLPRRQRPPEVLRVGGPEQGQDLRERDRGPQRRRLRLQKQRRDAAAARAVGRERDLRHEEGRGERELVPSGRATCVQPVQAELGRGGELSFVVVSEREKER